MNNYKINVTKWTLSINAMYGFFINKEVYEKVTGLNFEDSNYYINGKANYVDKKLYISIKANRVIDNKIVKGNFEYTLLDKNELYIQFEESVKNNTPIIYDWYIGVRNNKLCITGSIYEDGQFEDFIDIINTQDGNYLELDKYGKSLILWGAFNRHFNNSIGYKDGIIDKLFNCESIDIFSLKNIFKDMLDFKSSFINMKNSKLKKMLLNVKERELN
jgi:hypothetical protein